jgi:hypothetical protein
MPAARTHELLAACAAKGVVVTEVDENGKPLTATPAMREPGDDTESESQFNFNE